MRKNGEARYSQCARKKRYRDRDEANHVRHRREHEAGSLRAYPCPFCKGWHLTKQEEKRYL